MQYPMHRGPFGGGMRRWREEMDRMFDRMPFWQGWQGWQGNMWGPSVDVHETDNELMVSAEIPGVNPEDLDVTVSEDHLTLKGEIKQATHVDEQGYRLSERRYGSFHRVIPLPVEIRPNESRANYVNGVLEIHAPKSTEARSRSVKLRVNRGGTEGQTH